MKFIHEFSVEMTCEGCSNAVMRVMNKNFGDKALVEIDLPGKKVLVKSDLGCDEIKEKLMKTGKEVTLLSSKEN